jgi:hypothetical protein
MTEQAQKIWEAFCGELIQEPTDDMKEALATTIRAAADQVVPIEYEDIHGCWYEKKNRVREQFLAIAKELEAL